MTCMATAPLVYLSVLKRITLIDLMLEYGVGQDCVMYCWLHLQLII